MNNLAETTGNEATTLLSGFPVAGKRVLISWVSSLGKDRISIGFYAPKNTLSADDWDDTDLADVHNGDYYIPEGWYECKWGCFTAAGIGAPHLRERCFVVAYPMQPGTEGDWWGGWAKRRIGSLQKASEDGRHVMWPTEPRVERILPDGVANGMDRHYAIGNGQVPRVVEFAWRTLSA